MGPVLEVLGNYWWVIFPVSGVLGGGLKKVATYNEQRRRDKIELARIKATAKTEQLRITHATQGQVAKVLATHDELNRRWFDYEIDLATIINYPMMVDMREPLTLAFHRAKIHADSLRPDDPMELRDSMWFAEYRESVSEYSVAFDAAEREARRRKQSGFSPIERDALDRARKLVMVAVDEAATHAERQAAYRKARAELDGLIDVPQPAMERIERAIAGELER
ncbi:hypothetical protein [Gordonia asplenii]|uniref:hypothetical protein n=1 Tax=Gordonia asplenii TaxID=2725283 RepID=UPI0028A9A118|nr:hypothetical protein [Gordonia asplenii]